MQQSTEQQMPHSRYKTSLCNHWVESQSCAREDSCHFAHGESELRNPEQNQPKEDKTPLNSFQYLQNNWNSGLPHNYKSVLCKKFEQGNCQFGENCNYAHGKNELRKPDSKKSNKVQMQAIQSQVQNQMMQYNMMNIQNMMIVSQQLTQQMIELSKLDKCTTIKACVTQAKHFYQQGNLLECQHILNNCIFNDNHSFEDDEKEQLNKLREVVEQQQKQNSIQGQQMPMMPTHNMNMLLGMGMGMGMGTAMGFPAQAPRRK